MATHSSMLAWEIPWWTIVHGVTRDTTEQLNYHHQQNTLPNVAVIDKFLFVCLFVYK